WVNKDTMETKPAGFRYREGEYQEYAYSGIQVTTPKILHLLPKGKYSIIDFYLSICHRVDIQCYVEDDLQLIDIGKPENLEKAEEFLSKF
ncbi:nucleotidyltransferase family protein, partial [Phocaeicola vulgatus]|nr:nucleotidyltransferase family protein [Phocaeicola vulgatus]